MRKAVFGVSDQVPHKPGSTTTQDGLRLEISYLESRGIVQSASLFSHMQNASFPLMRLNFQNFNKVFSVFSLFLVSDSYS